MTIDVTDPLALIKICHIIVTKIKCLNFNGSN